MARPIFLSVLLAIAASAAHAEDAADQAALTEKAKAMFAATAAATCDDGDAGAAPDIHAIGFRYSYDSPEDPERTAHLFRFFCLGGAYNEIHVYYIADDDGMLSPLYFAEPSYDVRYAGDTDEKVEAISVTGFAANGQLVNSDYDPQARTITAHSQWRGVGDASSIGMWVFVDGGFRLVRYEVDASYDGEINPQVLLDHSTAP